MVRTVQTVKQLNGGRVLVTIPSNCPRFQSLTNILAKFCNVQSFTVIPTRSPSVGRELRSTSVE